MQFKVPQNIDMADRIVGPLTMVQFLYLLIGGLIVYFLFSVIGTVNTSLFLLISLPIILFSLALAFLKIQDQPFPKFVLSFFVYLSRPKIRIWHKEGLDPGLIIAPDAPDPKKQVVSHKKIKKSQLDQLIQVMDTGGHSQPAVAHPPKAAAVSPSLQSRAKTIPVKKQVKHG